jgi:hypothetical protein
VHVAVSLLMSDVLPSLVKSKPRILGPAGRPARGWWQSLVGRAAPAIVLAGQRRIYVACVEVIRGEKDGEFRGCSSQVRSQPKGRNFKIPMYLQLNVVVQIHPQSR